ncbi:hypothetical protein FHT44_000149 [Mycolicibacterium sp. BK634]|uniref:hypothetical protein n=1 Tax=Mycolicibacterium sp. BK634 TaxID=2587099 RepID=UPI00161EAB14|nr:hypothetical protein [Mycolicibacterium sp. BK634]MBB3747688.1 hypothetical protein [Mycolicibacterium sp. BK634]
MTITAKLALTTLTTLTTLAAPVLAALAIGLAGHAAAETPETDGGTVTASDTVTQLRDQGIHVVVNKDDSVPLEKCSVISVHQDRHEHHGGQQRDAFATAYVDVFCAV